MNHATVNSVEAGRARRDPFLSTTEAELISSLPSLPISHELQHQFKPQCCRQDSKEMLVLKLALVE